MAERLVFSASLYAPEAVKLAAAAFEHLGKITLEQQDDALVLEMTEADPEVADVLLDELANHALALTVQSRS